MSGPVSLLSRLRVFAGLVVALLVATGVEAGECRSRVRPLLLAPSPSVAELATVEALCRAEANAGDADAGYQLSFFQLGLGGVFAPEVAIPLITRAAEAGVSEAQYWLAWQREDGPLLPHDQTLALKWYQAAADQRHRLALDRLARAYETGGLGLTQDSRQALRLRALIRQCQEEESRQAGARPD